MKEFKTRDTENVVNEQMKWDFLKHGTHKVFTALSLNHFKWKKSKEVHNLEKRIKVLGTKLLNDKNIKLYNTPKPELD